MQWTHVMQFRDQLIAAPLKQPVLICVVVASAEFRDQLIAAPLKRAGAEGEMLALGNSAIN